LRLAICELLRMSHSFKSGVSSHQLLYPDFGL